MRKAIMLAGTVALTLLFAAPALAQHGGAPGGQAATPPQAQAPMPMCAMMSGMQPGAAAGGMQGGMQGNRMMGDGMMGGGMMGMMASMDPAALQMRGEMMKAMGEIMMKYGKTMEKPAR